MIARSGSVRRSIAVLVATPALAVGAPAQAQNAKACIAASEEAVTLKNADKLLDARKQLALCAASSCPDVVKSSCQQRLAEIGPAIPSFVLFAKDATGGDLTAVRLSIDGASYADRLDGRAIELDPGEHELRLEAAGHSPVIKRMVLHQGERDRREIIAFGSAAPAAPSPSSSYAPVTQPGHTGSTQRTLGWIVGGAGVAAFAAGGVFGLLAISAHASYEQHCGGNIGAPLGACDTTGVAGQSDAATKATVSTVLVVGGVVAAAVGLTLLLTAPTDQADAGAGARLDVGLGGIDVKGWF